MLYFLHSTSVLSFYIDVFSPLAIKILTMNYILSLCVTSIPLNEAVYMILVRNTCQTLLQKDRFMDILTYTDVDVLRILEKYIFNGANVT